MGLKKVLDKSVVIVYNPKCKEEMRKEVKKNEKVCLSGCGV